MMRFFEDTDFTRSIPARIDRTRSGYPPRISRVVPPSEVPLYNP